jgi:hypothetical protein
MNSMICGTSCRASSRISRGYDFYVAGGLDLTFAQHGRASEAKG